MIFLIFNSQSIKASEQFLEDFEHEIIPINYSTYLEVDTSILLTNELQYSGEKSLKLTNTNPDGSCNIRFPLNIEYSADLVIDFYQYFEESEPFYWIGVLGVSNGTIREFILEYGNPYSDWIEDSVYLVRGFNIPEKQWFEFSANINNDLQQALQHPNSPVETFIPSKITFFLIALDPGNPERIIYIDSMQIRDGDSTVKFSGATTSLQNFNATFYRTVGALVILILVISVIRYKYEK